MIHYPDEKLEDMISHLCSLSSRRLVRTSRNPHPPDPFCSLFILYRSSPSHPRRCSFLCSRRSVISSPVRAKPLEPTFTPRLARSCPSIQPSVFSHTLQLSFRMMSSPSFEAKAGPFDARVSPAPSSTSHESSKPRELNGSLPVKTAMSTQLVDE